jgi:hypothetical protein
MQIPYRKTGWPLGRCPLPKNRPEKNEIRQKKPKINEIKRSFNVNRFIHHQENKRKVFEFKGKSAGSDFQPFPCMLARWEKK